MRLKHGRYPVAQHQVSAADNPRRRIAIAFRATRSAEVSNLVSNLRESAEFYDVRIKQSAQRAGGYDLSLILTVVPDESDSRPLD